MWVSRLSHSLLPILLVLAALWAVFSGRVLPLDRSFYDTVNPWRKGAQVEHSVVIAIDDQSLAALGRWPWPRERHAQLIDRLQQAGSGPVVVDIVFADADAQNPKGDKSLVRAMERHGNVYLPVIIEALSASGQLVEVLPHAPFLYAAKGLGHVHIACEDDGICRSVYLREGLGEARWPHIALAAAHHGRSVDNAKLPGTHNTEALVASPYWVHRDFHNFIPFSSDDSLQVVSAIDVLDGRVAPEVFTGKTVYIGATAAGMNDVVSTPAGRRAGVLVTALVEHHLRAGSLITRIESPWLWLSLAVLLAAAMIAASFMGPGRFFLAMLLLVALLLAGQAAALLMANRWLPLMAFVVMIAVYYPLWSWLRLELAMHFLQRSLQARSHRPSLPLANVMADSPRHSLPWWQGKDVIARTIEQLDNANRLHESTYILLQQTFSSLQEGCCIFDSSGNCHLVNKLMADYFPTWQHQSMASLGEQLVLPEGWQWHKAMSGLLARGQSFSCEAKTLSADAPKALLLQAQSCHFVVDDRAIVLGVLTVTDVTALKASEQSRREMLAFISHDLRSPLVSILSLLKNHQPASHSESALLEQIEQYANRNLAYTESLLQLNRAEQIPTERYDLVDLHAVCDDAYLQVLPFAKERQCPMKLEKTDSESWVMGDFELLQRMLVNILSNAVKYGASARGIVLSLVASETHVTVTIKDYGPGLKAPIGELLQSYSRPAHNQAAGAGLGLYFVNTVVSKHDGKLNVSSAPATGCEVQVILPLTTPPEVTD